MRRLELDIPSSASPEQVIAALTDFSERRPEIWPGITPDLFEVYSVGEKTASVKEGAKASGVSVWVRERYDWSEPGVVSTTVEESNFAKPGSSWRAEIQSRVGGSNIRLTWEREGSNLKGRFVIWLICRMKGKPIVRSFRKGLGIIEKGVA